MRLNTVATLVVAMSLTTPKFAFAGDIADGAPCTSAADCASKVCSGGKCAVPACDDNVKNGAETDRDCGGSHCQSCPDGSVCRLPGDCNSSVCTGGRCATPTCVDGVMNGTETDTDCGGRD